ncbi:MAG: hypothetical protein IPK82_16010 [Polyangiaceae bacterium]|nr:hypothetical protein [Polyangiaceae bacterium]
MGRHARAVVTLLAASQSRVRFAITVVLALLAASACSTQPPTAEPQSTAPSPEHRFTAPGGTGTTPQPSTAVVNSAVTAPPVSPPPTGDCDALARQFDTVQKAASNKCATADDCGCYPDLRVDGQLLVIDKTAAQSLTLVSNTYRKQKCPTVFASSALPPVCSAQCQGGSCK